MNEQSFVAEILKSDSHFHTTCWTRVISASRDDSTESRKALGELCENYYEPVSAYLERSGLNREVAHEFFEHILSGNRLRKVDREKGRFRSYLLGALKHFLSRRREKELAEKRGGKLAGSVSLNQTGVSEIIQGRDLPPDAWFDKQWALALLSRAMDRLENSCREKNKEKEFELLNPWLSGEADYGDQADLAEKLSVPVNTLKSMIHRLRRQFREAVKTEIAETLSDSADLDAEMAALFSALREN